MHIILVVKADCSIHIGFAVVRCIIATETFPTTPTFPLFCHCYKYQCCKLQMVAVYEKNTLTINIT